MSATERTRALTQRLWDARDAGDAHAIAELLDEDVVLHLLDSLGMEPVTGRERLATVLSGVVARTYLHADTIRREQLLLVADGDVAVVKSRLSGRTLDDAEYDNEYVNVLFWRDGLVVRIDEHPDTLRIAQSGIAKFARTGADAQ
jgi:ketosteroid isomerase-like protein